MQNNKSHIIFEHCSNLSEQKTLYQRFHPHPLHAPFWDQALHLSYGYRFHLVKIIEHGETTGILTYYEKRLLFIRLIFTSFGSICTENQRVLNAATNYYLDLLTAANTFGQVWIPANHSSSIPPDFLVTTRYNFIIDLSKTDNPWTLIKSKEKNLVRKCEKSGITTVITQDIKIFYPVYAERMNSKSVSAYSEHFFKQITKVTDDYLIIAAYSDDTVIGAIFCILEDDKCFYFAGGIDESKRLPINYLLVWKMVKYCHESGISKILMGESSKESNVYNFKKKFGIAETHTYVSPPQSRVPAGIIIRFLNIATTVCKKIPYLPHTICQFRRHYSKVI